MCNHVTGLGSCPGFPLDIFCSVTVVENAVPGLCNKEERLLCGSLVYVEWCYKTMWFCIRCGQAVRLLDCGELSGSLQHALL